MKYQNRQRLEDKVKSSTMHPRSNTFFLLILHDKQEKERLKNLLDAAKG